MKLHIIFRGLLEIIALILLRESNWGHIFVKMRGMIDQLVHRVLLIPVFSKIFPDAVVDLVLGAFHFKSQFFEVGLHLIGRHEAPQKLRAGELKSFDAMLTENLGNLVTSSSDGQVCL